MSWRRFSALLLVATVPTLAHAAEELGPSDRVQLAAYSKDTWRSFEAMAYPNGLPADSLTRVKDGQYQAARFTSPSDIAAYLWSIISAEDLKVISPSESRERMSRTLATLVKLDRSHGFYYNWYDPSDGSTLKVWPGGGAVRPFLSTVDNGWLAASLMMVRNARPAFREVADEILGPMDFGFFYDPYDSSDPIAHPGLLRGGFYADDNTYAGYHYGMLNTEARIASYIGIARKQLPPDHYYRMSRSRRSHAESKTATNLGENRTYLGVLVDEGFNTYRGLKVVPSWDGSMFEAMMVSLFIPEAEWGPTSWGVNHPLYVRASIEFALDDAKLPAWGISPSCVPTGGYKVYGVSALSVDRRSIDSANEAVMTPHATFLALPFAPKEAIKNASVLAERFKAYGPHGFYDAVDARTGRVSDVVLALDQGMIMASINNALNERAVQKAFCGAEVDANVRPLLGLERFSAGVELADQPARSPSAEKARIELARLASRARTFASDFVSATSARSISLLLSVRR